MQGYFRLWHHWFWGKSLLVEKLVFRMEVGSYQVGPLCLCSYIIWSSWSLQLLHMIWYSGAHWSMADCTISSFFTLSHIPTFELLKLDLRTWIDSSTPSLSFRVTPKGCRSNEWAWIAMAQQLNLEKTQNSHILYKSNTRSPTYHSFLSLPFLVFGVPDTFSPVFGYNFYWIPMKQPHRNWKAK